MKHLFLFLLGVGSLVSCTKNSTETKVEEKSLPTESLSLEQWLFNNNYDKNHNSKIDPTEVNSIKELNISGQKLKDLKVLNLFTSLENLDASNNYLSEVEFPYQSQKLRKINLQNNQLVKLDISQCYNL